MIQCIRRCGDCSYDTLCYKSLGSYKCFCKPGYNKTGWKEFSEICIRTTDDTQINTNQQLITTDNPSLFKKYAIVIVIVLFAAFLISLAVLLTVLARYFYAKQSLLRITPGANSIMSEPNQVLRPLDQNPYIRSTQSYPYRLASPANIIDVSESGVNYGMNIGNKLQSNQDQRPSDPISSSNGIKAPVCRVTNNGGTYAADSDVHQAMNIGNGSLSNQIQLPDQNSSNKSTLSSSYVSRNFNVSRV